MYGIRYNASNTYALEPNLFRIRYAVLKKVVQKTTAGENGGEENRYRPQSPGLQQLIGSGGKIGRLTRMAQAQAFGSWLLG